MSSSSPESKYVILMETNGKECESWYSFIKYDGNEEALEHLQKQLEEVEFYIIDDLSTFDLDLEHKVSEQTAKEMTKVELNAVSFHRKFDGPMRKVDLGFRPKDKNEKKILKCFKVLGIGRIAEFVDDEDVDEEDMIEVDSDASSEVSTEYEYEISDDSESESEDEDDKKKKNGKQPDRKAERNANDRRVKDKIMEMLKNRKK